MFLVILKNHQEQRKKYRADAGKYTSKRKSYEYQGEQKRAAELLFSVSYAIASGLKVASGCDN
ncbi:MAG: hypothetical protein U0074_16920 [Kouleothrix sp.]